MHSGRLSEGKGTFLVVEVCARLKALHIPFRARITGAADAATANRLHDILVHLSRIDSYPLIVLEAIACSMLPVCIGLAGARDMIQQYDDRAVEEAAAVQRAVEFLATAEIADIRRRANTQASRIRTDYSWRLCAVRLEDALNACVFGSVAQKN